MTRHTDIAELPDQYREESGRSEEWITVHAFRTYFHLAESYGPAISGFFRKIHCGPFFSCRYKGARMEKCKDTTPPLRIIRRYLVQERPVKRNHLDSGAKKFVL